MSNLKVASFCRDQVVVVVVVNHGSERLDRHVHDGVQDFRSVWSVRTILQTRTRAEVEAQWKSARLTTKRSGVQNVVVLSSFFLLTK